MLSLLRLLLLGIISYATYDALKRKKIHISNESNSHDEFLEFNINLSITKTKSNRLKQARRGIKRKLKTRLKKSYNYPEPRFATQGSFTTGTMIRNEKDWCDLDMGIYFFKDPKLTYGSIQKHIKEALFDHTDGEVKLLPKCIRVIYSDDFHIDLPIYIVEKNETFLLGSKGNIWEKCDSKKFKDWVAEAIDGNDQITRIVRYFKAWSDRYKSKSGRKMPSGLVFTIWAIQNYESDNRDDIALVKTASNMLSELKSSWTCEMPVEPHDNVLDRLNGDQQDNFKEALKELIKTGYEALTLTDKTKSLRLWKSLFGKRFAVNNLAK